MLAASNDELTAARGIVIALPISIALWIALIAFVWWI